MNSALPLRWPVLAPLNAIVLSFPIALFCVAVATDVAYLKTAEIQWTNFSAWLIVGGLLFGGVALALALVGLLVGWRDADRRRGIIYVGVLALMFILGLINAFKHSQDAWSSVGAFGMVLSILTAVLALAAGVILWSNIGIREGGR
jgi:uncharacterized membrane protein